MLLTLRACFREEYHYGSLEVTLSMWLLQETAWVLCFGSANVLNHFYLPFVAINRYHTLPRLAALVLVPRECTHHKVCHVALYY